VPLAPEDKSADGKDKYKDYFESADAFPGVILGRICKKNRRIHKNGSGGFM